MDEDAAPDAWPSQLSNYWIEGAEIVASDASEEVRPGRDSLGNPGRVVVVKRSGRLGVLWPRAKVVERLAQRGLRAVRDTAEETHLTSPHRAGRPEDADPFLIEESVDVTVSGRELPARQREAIEAKVGALRRECADEATPAQRRAAAGAMLRDLGEGLRCLLDVRTLERRFQPAVSVKDPVESIGRLVPLRSGSRIVYGVAAAKPEPGDEIDAEPMVFHVVALGVREAVMLYTGGVHGHRHLRDLESSRVHHAWFANRERVKTEATAPWIGRSLYRELETRGRGEIVVEKRRDVHAVGIERTGTGTARISVDGADVDVPVMRCATSLGDEFVVLADAASPLVLRLEERGAELVRTIDAIHTAPAIPFVAVESVAAVVG